MKKKLPPLGSVVMGSDSDFSIMKSAMDVLGDFGIPYEVVLTSAHRSPERTSLFAKNAAQRGIRVIIAGAGAAAHLAGVIASQALLPVIGVPINSPPLNGLDALLATVQMPGGIPVATMAIGNAGAKNAALMAVRILALGQTLLQKKLQAYSEELARDIEARQEKLDCLVEPASSK
jgi:phosphoribosylaminoimidazole carboxylase PurE protein